MTKTAEKLVVAVNMKDLMESRIVLRTSSHRNRKALQLSLSPSRHAPKVIPRFIMEYARGSNTLMETGQDFITGTKIKHHEIYHETVSAVMYLMVETPLDIAYAIETVAKFLETSADAHWKDLQKVIRYHIQSKSLGLIFDRTCHARLTSNFDAD